MKYELWIGPWDSEVEYCPIVAESVAEAVRSAEAILRDNMDAIDYRLKAIVHEGRMNP